MIRFIDLAAQQDRLRTEIEAGISRVLAHGKYILGPEVDLLEERLAAYCGAKYCISCANGTDALQIALMALGVGPGDEVVTPAFSYIATAEAAALLPAWYAARWAHHATLAPQDTGNCNRSPTARTVHRF